MNTNEHDEHEWAQVGYATIHYYGTFWHVIISIFFSQCSCSSLMKLIKSKQFTSNSHIIPISYWGSQRTTAEKKTAHMFGSKSQKSHSLQFTFRRLVRLEQQKCPPIILARNLKSVLLRVIKGKQNTWNWKCIIWIFKF